MACCCCRWQHRHAVFKLATAGLVMSATMFTIGFSLPRWYSTHGLWTYCGIYSCVDSIPVVEAPWLGAIQGLLCLSFVGYSLCLGAEIYQDLWRMPPSVDNHLVEILAVCTGILSLLGAVLFLSKTSDMPSALDSWSLWLVFTASIIHLTSAAMIAISRKLHAQYTLSQMTTADVISPVSNISPPEDQLLSQSAFMLAPTKGIQSHAAQCLDRFIMTVNCSRWHNRHAVFKLATAGLVMSATMFIIGFSLPRWYSTHGLWTYCGIDSCVHSIPVVEAPWLGTIQGMLCLSLAGYILCLGVELYQDLFTCPSPSESSAVEVLALCTGMLSMAGSILYVSKTSDRRKALEAWSFWLVISSSIFVLISAALLAVSRRIHAQYTASQTTTAGLTMEPMPVTPSPENCLSPTAMLTHAVPVETQVSNLVEINTEIPPPAYRLPPAYPYHLVLVDCPQLFYPLPQTTAPPAPTLGTQDLP